MKIEILGSGREVGRSGILVKGRTSVVLDYGVKIQPEPPQYLHQGADACVISHSHLDHVGSAPNLFKSGKPAMYMTDVTLAGSELLLRDSFKVGKKIGNPTPFSEHDIETMVKRTVSVPYRKLFNINEFKCQLYDSGHIPGSSSILLDNGKKIFYTGDIQTYESNLLKPAQLPNKVDVLITESTYGLKNHPNRQKEEQRFVEHVEEALSRSEVVLIPVFAIGRAQEVLLILEKFADKIAIDGMARSASEIIARHGAYLKEPKRLHNVLKKTKFIHTNKERITALEKYPVIISSAGMLGGGPAIHYLRAMQKRKQSKVLFTGFLVEESPGRNLIQTKIFQTAEERFHVHCELEQFNLSAHADRAGLFKIIEHTKPEMVICVHGDSCEKFAKDIAERYNIQAFGPANGEVIGV